MGGSSKQTVGYWYYWAWHFGWCRGPVDALLELQCGGKTAWQGRVTANKMIYIDQPNLWGGEDNQGQGGVQGTLQVMFGAADQPLNGRITQVMNSGIRAYNPKLDMLLTGLFGIDIPDPPPISNDQRQSAHRGKFTTFFSGKYGAYSPSPKPASAKVERILADWLDDTPWYPEKAPIVLAAAGSMPVASGGWDYQQLPYESDPGNTNLVPPTSGWQTGGVGPFTDDNLWTRTPDLSVFWVRKTVSIPGTGLVLHAAADNGCVLWVNGQLIGSSNPDNLDIASNELNPVDYPIPAAGEYEIIVKAYTESASSDQAGNYLAVSITGNDLRAMNPAHILYDSITYPDMQGEPVGLINDASFRAAADKLYDEGFGLCTDYDSSTETPEQFQQRICNVIGAALSQSRIDGLYYLDLIRGDYELDSLPIISEDDVTSFTQDPSVITETGNMMRVEWFDPVLKQVRTTAPQYAMGNVRSAGRVIPADPKTYHEIPIESLALRVAARDLKASAVPISKLTLDTLGTQRGLRPGMLARLQLPTEGIADMVVVIGSVVHGTATNAAMKIVAVQNVYNMPTTVYVGTQTGSWTPPDTTPAAAEQQRVIEAPYIELAQTMDAASLQALTEDAAYLLTVASRPEVGDNYAIDTAAAGEDYVQHGTGEWCPIATVVEAADYTTTDFTLTGGDLLYNVAIGSWALWDDEIVRVDALDTDALTVTLARGCADTVPATHAAGALIYFAGDWVSSDKREYVDGDTVNAKLLTSTSGSQQDVAGATALSVDMVGRAALPYPPANVKIGGTVRPATGTGDLVLTWATRNRVVQADQLVDTTAASIAPELDVRTALKVYDSSDTLLVEKLDITGSTATVALAVTDTVRIVLYTTNTTGDSLQRQTISLDYTPAAGAVDNTITASTWTPVVVVHDGGLVTP